MAKLTPPHGLLVQEIKDLYSAETQLIKALPKMAGAASDPELQKGRKSNGIATESQDAYATPPKVSQ